jgi:hypothetical protein
MVNLVIFKYNMILYLETNNKNFGEDSANTEGSGVAQKQSDGGASAEL